MNKTLVALSVSVLLSCGSLAQAADDTSYQYDNGYSSLFGGSNYHFYLNAGVNATRVNLPDYVMPVAKVSSVSSTDYSSSNLFQINPAQSGGLPQNVQSSFALGMSFDSDSPIADIFGTSNQLEFQYQRVMNHGNENTDFGDNYWALIYPISGDTFFNTPLNFGMQDSSVSFDQRIDSYQLLYKGNKAYGSRVVNHPYMGLSLDQIYNQDTYQIDWVVPGGANYKTNGSNDLKSNNFGMVLGDKLSFAATHDVDAFVDLNITPMLIHAQLASAQRIVNLDISGKDAWMSQWVSVNRSDNKMSFKAQASVGASYYFTGRVNPNSWSITAQGGLTYWHDVAYAKMPQADGEAVAIAYTYSLQPFVGAQLHIPLA
jgi:hypothetical protein